MGTARRPPSSLGGQKPLTITERERERETSYQSDTKDNINGEYTW